MRQFTRPQPPVKPARRTPRPAAPFGQGVQPLWTGSYGFIPDPDDQAWAAQAFAGELEFSGDGGIPWDQIAAEREWEDRYERGLIMGDRCAACGLTDCGGACVQTVADPDNGGVCRSCNCWSDYRDAIGRCPACDTDVAESSSQASTYAGAGLGWIDP